MKTQLVFLFLFLFLAVVTTVIFYAHQPEKENTDTVYQGPVPEGYDEDYFRKTGITKPLEK